jgi:hypothetical protein
MKSTLIILVAAAWLYPSGSRAADDYDARIRKEASLPEGWFTCKTVDDCVLVNVPCSWSIAVNVDHKIEAQDAIHKTLRSQRCLGNALDISLAACEAGQCITKHETAASSAPRATRDA